MVAGFSEQIEELVVRADLQKTNIDQVKEDTGKAYKKISEVRSEFDDMTKKMAKIFGESGNLQAFVQDYENDKV